MRACVRAYVRAYVRTCVRVHVCTCVRVYVCTCVRVYVWLLDIPPRSSFVSFISTKGIESTIIPKTVNSFIVSKYTVV